MDTLPAKGDFVSLEYIGEKGLKDFDEGFVVSSYKNGQFIVSDRPNIPINPRRYEMCGVTIKD